ncbi:transposase [Nonomuraea africana]|uniref:transposase n=1 Tax=Nonomuraea africana TaxID=46171 RepID=UPI0033F24966
MSEREPYSSDLSDERWALIEPVITAWKAAHPSVSGHQGRYAMRGIVTAILYQSRTGCQWNLLPHDLPPRSAAYYCFAYGVMTAPTKPSMTCCSGRPGRRTGD